MEQRLAELDIISSSIKEIDAEITLVLQNLNWDRKKLLEKETLSTCSHNPGHSVPVSSKNAHEERCLLRSLGYASDEELLPDPPDCTTVVKFDNQQIQQVINNSARSDPKFKRGPGYQGPVEPLSLSALLCTYTSDERRAIHDAVVASAPPFVWDEDDFVASYGGTTNAPTKTVQKTHAQVLAELRDMKRRRTKYRVVAKTDNYSHVLRDLIATQMEMYSDAKNNSNPELMHIKQEPNSRSSVHYDDHRPHLIERDRSIHRYRMCDEDRHREAKPTYTEPNSRSSVHYDDHRPHLIERDRSVHRNRMCDEDRRREAKPTYTELERERERYTSKSKSERDRYRYERREKESFHRSERERSYVDKHSKRKEDRYNDRNRSSERDRARYSQDRHSQRSSKSERDNRYYDDSVRKRYRDNSESDRRNSTFDKYERREYKKERS